MRRAPRFIRATGTGVSLLSDVVTVLVMLTILFACGLLGARGPRMPDPHRMEQIA